MEDKYQIIKDKYSDCEIKELRHLVSDTKLCRTHQEAFELILSQSKQNDLRLARSIRVKLGDHEDAIVAYMIKLYESEEMKKFSSVIYNITGFFVWDDFVAEVMKYYVLNGSHFGFLKSIFINNPHAKYMNHFVKLFDDIIKLLLDKRIKDENILENSNKLRTLMCGIGYAFYSDDYDDYRETELTIKHRYPGLTKNEIIISVDFCSKYKERAGLLFSLLKIMLLDERPFREEVLEYTVKTCKNVWMTHECDFLPLLQYCKGLKENNADIVIILSIHDLNVNSNILNIDKKMKTKYIQSIKYVGSAKDVKLLLKYFSINRKEKDTDDLYPYNYASSEDVYNYLKF